MYTVPQTGLTLPAVAGRGLNEGLGVAVADANALLINDPQLPLHALRSCEAQSSQHKGFDCLEGLLRGPEHPDSWVRPRWVGPDVREIQIERDQDSAFCGAGMKHRVVRGAGQSFFGDSVCVKAKGHQRLVHRVRKVFVELELQA